jgi:hypothetical protein
MAFDVVRTVEWLHVTLGKRTEVPVESAVQEQIGRIVCAFGIPPPCVQQEVRSLLDLFFTVLKYGLDLIRLGRNRAVAEECSRSLCCCPGGRALEYSVGSRGGDGFCIFIGTDLGRIVRLKLDSTWQRWVRLLVDLDTTTTGNLACEFACRNICADDRRWWRADRLVQDVTWDYRRRLSR